jgi:hypothetical protein
MSMLTRCVAVLVLAAAALGAGGGAGTATQGGRAGSYTDAVNGFSMSVPAFAEARQERAVVVIFQALPEDGFTPNVTVMIDPVKTTREEYLKASEAAIDANNPRANKREARMLKVSGKDAMVLDFDAGMGGRRLRFVQLVVIAEDRVYVVTCTAPVETFGNYQAQFQKCVDSFRLEK